MIPKFIHTWLLRRGLYLGKLTPFRTLSPPLFLPIILILTLGVTVLLPPQTWAQLADNTPDLFQGDESPADDSPLNDITTIDGLMAHMRDRQPPLGSRSNVCAVSPGLLGTTGLIWSDRPLFLWRGGGDRLIVREFDSRDVVWETDISNLVPSHGLYQVAYGGDNLSPGTFYSWQLANESGMGGEFLFEVMEAETRDRLSQELQTVPSNNGGLARAKYFATQELWSDSLQTLYEHGRDGDADLTSVDAFIDYLCRTL